MIYLEIGNLSDLDDGGKLENSNEARVEKLKLLTEWRCAYEPVVLRLRENLVYLARPANQIKN